MGLSGLGLEENFSASVLLTSGARITLCWGWGSCLIDHRVFSNIPGSIHHKQPLHPTSWLRQAKMSPDIAKYLLGWG